MSIIGDTCKPLEFAEQGITICITTGFIWRMKLKLLRDPPPTWGFQFASDEQLLTHERFANYAKGDVFHLIMHSRRVQIEDAVRFGGSGANNNVELSEGIKGIKTRRCKVVMKGSIFKF